MPYLSEFAELTAADRSICDQFETILNQRIGEPGTAPGRVVHWLSVPETLTYEMILELRARYRARGWTAVEIHPFAERTYHVVLER